MSMAAYSSRDRSIIDGRDEENLDLNEIAGKRLNVLMSLISESIINKQKQELIQYLNELSEILRIQVNEQILAHNTRIQAVLISLQKNDSQGNWNNSVVISSTLRNNRGEFLESQDLYTPASIDRILALPVSHDGILPAHRAIPSREREFMLLKIYGISIEMMNQVLNKR